MNANHLGILIPFHVSNQSLTTPLLILVGDMKEIWRIFDQWSKLYFSLVGQPVDSYLELTLAPV